MAEGVGRTRKGGVAQLGGNLRDQRPYFGLIAGEREAYNRREILGSSGRRGGEKDRNIGYKQEDRVLFRKLHRHSASLSLGGRKGRGEAQKSTGTKRLKTSLSFGAHMPAQKTLRGRLPALGGRRDLSLREQDERKGAPCGSRGRRMRLDIEETTRTQMLWRAGAEDL